MDAEDFINFVNALRTRGAVVRQRNYRGKANDELKELCQNVAALDDEQIGLVVYTLAVAE